MARRATLVNTATKGVLDPDLSERIDLKHYYDSLAAAENVEVRPQGGIARRAGTLLNSDADVLSFGIKRRMRRRLEPIAISAGAITVHNGGTAANLVDQNPATLFTTSAVAGATFVIAEVDLGVATEVCFIDVQGFFAETAAADNVLAIEYFNGAAWVEFVGALETGVGARRHIRTRGFQAPITIDLASTTEFKREGLQVVDGVQTTAGMNVLLKDDANPTENGVWTVASPGAWARASFADTAAEILKAAYFISQGDTNGGTTWVNNQKSLSDLNDINLSGGEGVASIITYELAPSQGRTRRFGSWPGGNSGTMISARNWRVVVKGGAGVGAVSVAGLRFWRERRAISPAKVFAFDRSIDTLYDLVLLDRTVDVFKRSASGSRRYVASIPVPIAAHQIEEITAIQSLDTMVLFHEDVPTVRIVRQGSDVEWNVDTLPAYNVPLLRPGTSFSGDQNEIQDVALLGIETGDTFVIHLGDLVTAPITYAGTGTIAALVSAAIDTLPGLAAPLVTVLDASPRLRITFNGANGGRAWPALEFAMRGDAVALPTHTIVQQGLDADGQIFSARTGWPRCGFFTQGRILLAGFRAAPRTWGVSAIETYDFKDDPGRADEDDAPAPPLTADMAYFRTLDTDQIETIQQVFVGRNLQFFTDSSEWYVESRTLDATQPATAVRATGIGVKSSVRVTFAEGATVIVQQGGRTINDFLFNDVEQSYKTQPLSLLGPHLLTNVIDVAHRKGRTTQEAGLIYFINADGSLVTLSLMRAQDVIGMVGQSTDGHFRTVVSHFNGDVVYLIERSTVSGGADLYMEVRDETCVLDAATRVTSPTPISTITGLDHLEGKAVWVFAGAQLCGPFTVTSGSVSIDADDAATTLTVGLFPPVSGRLQKVRETLQQNQPFRAPARIYEAGISLKNTGHLQVRANGTAWREVPLSFMDGGTLDHGQLTETDDGYGPELPMLDRLLTGEVTVQNLRGWSRHPIFEFRQIVPAPLHIKAMRLELSYRG